MPTKGALTQARDRISYTFFRDQFEELKLKFKKTQKKFKGLYVYGIDGDTYSIPRTKNTLSANFYGQPVTKNRESHFLRMYAVLAVDVFSGATLEFSYGNECKELELGLCIIDRLENKSLSIYDRLYYSKRLVRKHLEHGSYFLCRLQTGAIKEADELFNTKKRLSSSIVDEHEVRIIKIINPKTKAPIVFATNLPKKKFTILEISKLYIKRWESEIANKESTDTLKLEQFHSKNINGVLQEVYVHFWFKCYVKLQINGSNRLRGKQLVSDQYQKTNFKEVCDFLIRNLRYILYKFPRKIYLKLTFIINKSMEKRIHNKRTNPRINKNLKREYRGQRKCGDSRTFISPCSPRTKNKEFKMNHVN
jgi:hypothetical protein